MTIHVAVYAGAHRSVGHRVRPLAHDTTAPGTVTDDPQVGYVLHRAGDTTWPVDRVDMDQVIRLGWSVILIGVKAESDRY